MAFTMQVHQRDDKNSSLISKVRPYVRFNEKGQPPVFFQEGRYYSEDGKHINKPKKTCVWAVNSAENLSNKVKKEVGYVDEPKKRGPPTLEERARRGA